MGRVRTKTVKRSARAIVEKYYGKLTLDFDTNKRVTDEVALVPSKRMRNKIAGFVTVRARTPGPWPAEEPRRARACAEAAGGETTTLESARPSPPLTPPPPPPPLPFPRST
jgi:ribosomal protein S17E